MRALCGVPAGSEEQGSQLETQDPRHGGRGAPGTSVINIAGNSHSSSLLGMLPAHEEAAPSSKYIGTQEIIVETVDRLLPKIDHPNSSIWMKVDTQGFEGEVLKGSLDSLGRISTIQLEMSLVPLYDGSETFESLLQWMLDHHYGLVALQPGFTDNETGRLLQVDGIFHARKTSTNVPEAIRF